ncbi:M56 family metallopeptidase [Aneurinibacillus aneurinilyticus]|uniref:M48 family metalloprotease n=1 Tax=Aneurinibacillus aneurinilyticus TaxID=1391 RepID=A0A848D566_ANEAE|nr:M48 family metalloprotease [Aneurinibacillus aneurinilyticus]
MNLDHLSLSLLNFFDWVLKNSMMASVLVGLILLMKVILRNKLPPRWHYMLWLIIMVRLLLPWAPESSYSVYNFFTYGHESSQTADVSSINKIILDVSDSTAPIEEKQEPTISVFATEKKQDSTSISMYTLAFYVWLLGVVCLCIHTVIVNRRVYTHIKQQPAITDREIVDLFEECKKIMAIKQAIPLVLAGKISSPTVLGFIRPRVLLSDSLIRTLDHKQLGFIFYHELGHVKRRDVAINCLMYGLLILHWFNPILWYAYYRMREDQEIACDALALTFIGSEQKENYGHTLISLLEYYSKAQSLSSLANLTGYKKQLKRRMIMIKTFQKKSYRWSTLGLASLLALSSVSLVNAKETGQYSQESLDANLPSSPLIAAEVNRSSFATEQESNPIQQKERMIEQAKSFSFKEWTVDEFMVQKGMKSALESFYDQFPPAKAKITGSKVRSIRNGEKENEISLLLINNEKESFDLIFDTKTKKVTKCDQLVFDITESELPGTVQASLDTVYSLSTEAKNLKLRASTMYSDTMKGERQSKTYYFRFSDDRKVENSNKEFDIKLDETGKVQYFDFTKLPLVNIKGNTKEEKAQNLLKRLYREEANEYKIQKVNEISKDDPNYKEYVDFKRGAIVFIPTSSEKNPILVFFNTKDELTTIQVTTQDFLKDVGLLQ